MVDIDLTDIDMSGAIHRPCPKRGVLNFWHLPAVIENAELSHNGTTTSSVTGARSWSGKTATPVERYLLEYIGHGPLPTTLTTRVTWLTNGVRRREWPQLGESKQRSKSVMADTDTDGQVPQVTHLMTRTPAKTVPRSTPRPTPTTRAMTTATRTEVQVVNGSSASEHNAPKLA